GQVVGGQGGDHGHDHDGGLGQRHELQGAWVDGMPVDGAQGHDDHDGHQGGHGDHSDDITQDHDEDEQEHPGQQGGQPGAGPDSRTWSMVWPIMAHPPMPPKRPETILATPWPQDSRVLSEWVSVMSSTSLAVISDSMRPTIAMPSA